MMKSMFFLASSLTWDAADAALLAATSAAVLVSLFFRDSIFAPNKTSRTKFQNQRTQNRHEKPDTGTGLRKWVTRHGTAAHNLHTGICFLYASPSSLFGCLACRFALFTQSSTCFVGKKALHSLHFSIIFWYKRELSLIVAALRFCPSPVGRTRKHNPVLTDQPITQQSKQSRSIRPKVELG